MIIINSIITKRKRIVYKSLFSREIYGVGGWESENRGKWERSNVRRTNLGRHWQQALGKDINNSSQALGDYSARGY